MENIIADILTTNKLNSLDELMNLYEYAVFFFTNPENKKRIQRAFEASFGGGLFTRLRLIFENKDDQEFTKMNFPPIIMRKISDAIMSHFDDRLIVCRSNKCLMLRDLSNSDGNDTYSNDEMMSIDGEEEIDKVLKQHKTFLDDPKMRDEKEVFDVLKTITNIHESKYYYYNVKKLFPQVWKSFTKEEKNYLAQCITQFFKNYLKFMQNQKKKMNPEFEGFPNELLEIFQSLEPQIVLGPDMIMRVANKYNCWVNCILMLEQQLKVVPEYDKYNLLLNELYSNLEQDDYYINKCNTYTLKKCITYSQFRMWEEVNEEFNRALGELYNPEDINIDLKYANEYDQKVWEDIHPEAIVRVGDLDRQKFFYLKGSKNYGAFKAEFQKWMVLGKSQPTYQVFEANREKLCQEWTSLPRFIDQVHYQKLTSFQENVELNEIMALLHNVRGQPKESCLKNFFTASTIQRDRVPIRCESNRVWKDILENRYLPLNMLNNTLESKRRAGNDPAQDKTPKNRFAFKRLLNYVWDKILIARQARKDNVLEVCKKFLIEVEQQILKSDNDNLKGIALHKEKYLLIQERMKLILHYFKRQVRMILPNEELIKIKTQLISKGLDLSDKKVLKGLRKIEEDTLNGQDNNDPAKEKDKVYSEIWESEIYRLRGEIYMEAKSYDKANSAFLEALDLCSTSHKNWRSLAMASEKFADMAVEKNKSAAEIIDWTSSAVEGYVKTLKHHLFDSRMYIIKILDLITKNAKYDKGEELSKVFGDAFQNTQVWVWLFWIPQLLNLILRTQSEYEIAKQIMSEIAKLYPQPLFIALRTFYWYYGPNNKSRRNEVKSRITSLGKILYNYLNDQNNTNVTKDVIDSVIKELQKRFVVTPEEDLISLIEKGYTMSFREDFKPEKYLDKLWSEFFNTQPEKPYFISNTLRGQFIKDFMDGEGSDAKIVVHPFPVYQEKLKKWKDLLSRRLSLKFSPQSLVEISKKLANFNYRAGMELPGQYLEIDTEPFPEKRVLITRFEPNIFQNNKRKIIIRTNTGKRLTYLILENVKAYENPTKTDERINQFKVFMNKIFTYMHPETMRRGIKLGVFKKIIFPFSKLYEDNNQTSLDEIYKIACSEYGIDPDTATCLLTRDIKLLLKQKSEGTQNAEPHELAAKVKECNQYMRRLVDRDYLANHFKSILKTVDEYFMFRKQFSNYYASNSFLTYAFKLNDNTHSNIRICTRQGRIFHNECKLNYDKTRSALENLEENVPFRLSDNLKEFITEIGLNSLFPGVMTCCSLATEKKETYVRSFLRIFFMEEDMQSHKNSDENIATVTEDVMKRLLSFARPYFDREVSQLRVLNEENKNEYKSPAGAENPLLTKFAHELIHQAGNKKTLNEMNPCFISWF